MLTENEKQFLQYWEQHREREGSFTVKLLKGLPMSLLFSLPILLFIVVIRLFFPDWYTKVSATSSGTFITATFAVIITALFYSFFRMHFKWENNEQVYKSLKLRAEKKSNNNQQTDL